MSGTGDELSDKTRKKSKISPQDTTTEPTKPKTPQEEYDEDFNHMLATHDEHEESLAGRLNSKYPDSLAKRHFTLRTLHWKKHGILPPEWEIAL
jgi:hypothetical protein